MAATTFDPIAVAHDAEVGPNREPQFVHDEQVTEATGGLDGVPGGVTAARRTCS